MFWILQDNLYDEGAFTELLEQLTRQDQKFQVVKVIPFGGGMEPQIDPQDDFVITLGATSLSKISKAAGWVPGYFDDNLNYQTLLENYEHHMLNASCVVAEFGKLEKIWDEFHLRPVLDSKSFAGTVFSWDEFEIWRDKVKNLDKENSYTSLTLKDQVVMSPLTKIFAEYRFFVVDGIVITGSMYKQGTRVFYNNQVDSAVLDFAKLMVELWQPNRAFALDIADTPTGFKVIEINSLNSAGFYACDMSKFVAALSAMEFKKPNV